MAQHLNGDATRRLTNQQAKQKGRLQINWQNGHVKHSAQKQSVNRRTGPPDNRFSVNLPSVAARHSGADVREPRCGRSRGGWRPRTAINLGRARPRGEVNLLRLSGAGRPSTWRGLGGVLGPRRVTSDRARSTTKLRCLGIHRRRTSPARPQRQCHVVRCRRWLIRLMPCMDEAPPCRAKTSPAQHTALISIYTHYARSTEINTCRSITTTATSDRLHRRRSSVTTWAIYAQTIMGHRMDPNSKP